MSRLPRPRHATVVAYLALFVALGGTSYAAITVTGSNVTDESLTGQDVRDGSLRSRDVENNTLTSSDVRDSSLRERDFLPGSLPQGERGPAGPEGAKGDTGPVGPPGPSVSGSTEGPAGPAGPAGPVGPAGPAGPAGTKGDSGPTGERGPAGTTGPAGPTGDSGPTGENGSPGATGPVGATGQTGPRGPSNGYYFESNNDQRFSDGATIGKLDLPAGKYLVTSKVWLDNQEAQGRAFRCQLFNGAAEVDRGKSGLAASAGEAPDEQVMTLIGGAEVTSTGQLTLTCRRYNGEGFTVPPPPAGSEPMARWTHLTAIKVGELTRQAP